MPLDAMLEQLLFTDQEIRDYNITVPDDAEIEELVRLRKDIFDTLTLSMFQVKPSGPTCSCTQLSAPQIPSC